MPSPRLKMTKSGRRFYEIRVSRGRSKSYLSTRWYVPEGWSQKAIDKELTKVAAEFERQVKSGEIISREEQKKRDLQEKQEAAKIQTLRLPYLHHNACMLHKPYDRLCLILLHE